MSVRFSHAAKTVRADNDVIDHVHFHQFSCFDERFRHVEILLAWRQRSSRMIVRYDDRV